MSNAACDLAEALGARAILVPTFTRADRVSRRPAAAQAADRRLSHNQAAVQQMALEWGVTPILMPETENVEDLWRAPLGGAQVRRRRPGRPRRAHGRHGRQPAGTTNLIRVDTA